MPGATTTDLYEVTMAMSYLQEGMTASATFDLFVRRLPADRGFLVAAGIEDVLDHLAGLHTTERDLADFAAALGRPPRDVAPLAGLSFSGEVRAVPEGTVVLPGEPLVEVTAPLPEAQLVESFVLNEISYQTSLASKAVRSVLAADGTPVVDFSLRRTHSTRAAFHAARVGRLTGFSATSNVEAAAAWDIPATGTMAHSYIEAFGPEERAFRAFAEAHPGPVTLLVDTYDTAGGVGTAARVLRSLDRPGSAIRIDSGDLAEEAVRARRILDSAGLADVRIVVSGGLDEYAVDELRRRRAPVDVFAVGTKVGVSADAPYLDSAYKLVEYDGRPVMKLSTKKVTAPGRKQVHRSEAGGDLVTLADEEPPGPGRPLLRTLMHEGRRVHPREDLADARRRCAAEVAALDPAARGIHSPEPPSCRFSPRLDALTAKVQQHIEDAYTK
ncbi:nicotinate phosphoribosyltransferase [Streptomyces cacaoi]|uniref:nicotinate phosphoribosyltransferase n=1 Tax=Streptomyces cacaoi TaxID=1898 RepID=UPI002631A465|nr:nicotinate phosphoribosyltransferase [Streptomyces cacaoi]